MVVDNFKLRDHDAVCVAVKYKNPAVAGMDRPFVDVTRSSAVAGMADS